MRPSAGKLAGTAKIGERGQIVIPKDMRDMFGIKPGDTLLLLADVDRGIAVLRNDDFVELAHAVLDAQPKAETDE
jgi:AbrB family looped-hinge helix DNA binding protein